jgi:hypothetical protein
MVADFHPSEWRERRLARGEAAPFAAQGKQAVALRASLFSQPFGLG